MYRKYKVRKESDGNWHVWSRRYYLGGNFDWERAGAFRDWKTAMCFIGIEIR